MRNFQPHINVDYPPNNEVIFEEWFKMVYSGCKTDRELLPVLFTPFWVNNGYGQDKEARRELSDFLGTLDKSKKYFSVIQYDDGSMIDWRLFGLDVLEFNMSKTKDIPLPLTCMPHPYKFGGEKKYFASFVGSKTHPIRDQLQLFRNLEGWYISFEPHEIDRYCQIISQSIFTLCPRGYGINSFRITEALQYGSIPVYISDDFINPFFIPFYEFGITLHSKHIRFLEEELKKKSELEISAYQSWGKQAYDEYYTYHGCLKNIIRELETEYHNRQQKREVRPAEEPNS